MATGLTAFFLADNWANLKFWDQTIMLLKWWPRIVEQARKTPAGAGYIVPVKGTTFTTLRIAELKIGVARRLERFKP